jgi:hypothetical protein
VHEAFYRRLGGYRYVASSHVNRGEDFAYLPEAYGGMILAWYGFGTEAVAHVEAQDVRRRRAASLTRHSVDRVAGLAYSRGLTTASRSIRMRKFLVPVAAALVAVLAGCAHPTPPDGYGTTAPKPAPPATTAANTTADQAQVCSDAKSLSSSQVDLIKGKAAQAQAALGSGDQATLAQAINDLRSAASSWAAQLTQLSGKQITPQLKSVLTDGASTITALANSAAPPPNAQSQLDDFTNKLNAACS